MTHIRGMDQLLDRRGLLTASAASAAGLMLFGCASGPADAAQTFPYRLTDAQWKAKLSPDAYDVLRHQGTERPFSSPLNDEHRNGVFGCKGCGQPLYSSKTKFDSGTGWPSFWAPLKGAVGMGNDRSLMMTRTEVHCSRCGGHQGHVFDDGPKPTGKRYCMNGASMVFQPA